MNVQSKNCVGIVNIVKSCKIHSFVHLLVLFALSFVLTFKHFIMSNSLTSLHSLCVYATTHSFHHTSSWSAPRTSFWTHRHFWHISTTQDSLIFSKLRFRQCFLAFRNAFASFLKTKEAKSLSTKSTLTISSENTRTVQSILLSICQRFTEKSKKQNGIL